MNISKKTICLLILCAIMFSAIFSSCAVTSDTSDEQSENVSGEISQNENSGTAFNTDVDACVTNEDGTLGVLIDRKDVKSLPAKYGCILMQPSTTIPFELEEGSFAVTVKRRVKGGFEVIESGAEKISTKYFTLIFKGESNIEFAKQSLAPGEVCMMYNTDKISQFGKGCGIVIGKTEFEVDAINPQNAASGISVYDENYGFGVSPEYDGDFVDLLVFDGYILKKNPQNATCVMPFPNGCLIRFAGDAAEYADSLAEGDAVEAVGFDIECSPREYVLINGCKVEIAYRNEYRSAVSYAVMYDGDFAYDSTGTNIWGTEVAVDKDGFITEVVAGNIEGVSGDTHIPEDGFVLSSGYSAYSSYMTSSKVGDKAEYIEKDGIYRYRRIYDVKFNEYGEEGKEYISVISREVANRTRQITDAIYYIIDAEGYVAYISDHPVDIPDGGFAIVATGMKKTEIKRFCSVGDKIIGLGSLKSLFALATTAKETVDGMLTELKNEIAEAKTKLQLLDFEAIDNTVLTIEGYLNDQTKLVEAAKALGDLKDMLTPSITACERAAWVIDTDQDLADIKRTVAYAKGLGINTLILSPFRNTYALYDTNVEHLCRSKDMPDLDVLQAYIDECHANDIKLIFMLCCFIADKPSSAYEDDHFVNYFGNKLLISKTGRNAAYFYSDPSYTLNPYDSEVREFYKAIIKEVIAKYDVDGIQLDYIRFPLPTYYGESNYEDQGYNDDIIAAFQKQYRTSKDPRELSITDPMWEKWCAFRRDIITSFVKEVSRICNDTYFSVTCFAGYTDRQIYVFQDVEKWAQKGYIDAVYPMIYSASADEFIANASKLIEGVGESCRVVLGVGTYDGETDEVLKKQIDYAYESGCDGISVFALQYIQSCGFDGFYKNTFRDPATSTSDTDKAFNAYAEMLVAKIDKVYSYLCPDADFSSVRTHLETMMTDVTFKTAKKQFEKALSLMQSSDAPDEIEQDFAKEIGNILGVIAKAQ